jgi:hypothetical protein
MPCLPSNLDATPCPTARPLPPARRHERAVRVQRPRGHDAQGRTPPRRLGAPVRRAVNQPPSAAPPRDDVAPSACLSLPFTCKPMATPPTKLPLIFPSARPGTCTTCSVFTTIAPPPTASRAAAARRRGQTATARSCCRAPSLRAASAWARCGRATTWRSGATSRWGSGGSKAGLQRGRGAAGQRLLPASSHAPPPAATPIQPTRLRSPQTHPPQRPPSLCSCRSASRGCPSPAPTSAASCERRFGGVKPAPCTSRPPPLVPRAPPSTPHHPVSSCPPTTPTPPPSGNPDAELLTRWYQLGAFYPFFRGHAHIDAPRREPWLFGREATGRIRAAVRGRYALLPYVYTLFRLGRRGPGGGLLESKLVDFGGPIGAWLLARLPAEPGPDPPLSRRRRPAGTPTSRARPSSGRSGTSSPPPRTPLARRSS